MGGDEVRLLPAAQWAGGLDPVFLRINPGTCNSEPSKPAWHLLVTSEDQPGTGLTLLRSCPQHFSEPSILLYGLECFEGKEIELNREVRSLQAEGFNDHVLSVRIRGGV